MTGSIVKTNRTLKILRSCERSRLQRATLEAAYELVTPTLRRQLVSTAAAGRATEPCVQATAIFATGTGGNHS